MINRYINNTYTYIYIIQIDGVDHSPFRPWSDKRLNFLCLTQESGTKKQQSSAEARLCGLSEFICKRPVKDTLWYFSIHTYHVYQNSKDVYTDVISWRRWNHCFFNLNISDFISSGLDCVSFDCCWSSTSTSRHVGGELIFSVGSSSSKAARRFKNCIAWLVACLLIFMMLHLLFHPQKKVRCSYSGSFYHWFC